MAPVKLIVTVLLGAFFLTSAFAAQSEAERIAQLESKISQVELKVSRIDRSMERNGATGVVLILFGAFCALWAQNTRRNAWLWFFLGAFFNVITVLVLLSKNADDKFQRGQFGRAPAP